MKWSQPADRGVVQFVVKAFRDDAEDLRVLLLRISERQWQQSYYWLDASGMALYLLRRLEENNVIDFLPPLVLARLTQNLVDNTERSASMLSEFKALNRAFQDAGIEYCNLKGFTLTPHSCPHPSLRTQLDFDFLVKGEDLDRCREVLSSFGYSLRASTNTVLELKTDSNQLASISELYKLREQRSVELHFSCTDDSFHQPSRDERLEDLCWQQLDECEVPVLLPVDQFIGQATHILSHLCGPSTRLAWLLEFANHLTLRSKDQSFVLGVLERLSQDRDAEIALGAVCMLVRNLLRCPIPEVLESGPVHNLPSPVKLWINHYGIRAVLADFPGTKLHLLLREQLVANSGRWKKEKSRALLPLSRPPRILHIKPGAGVWRRITCELYQLRYELFRLRFHVVQGLVYLREAQLWRQLLKRHGPSSANTASLRSEVVPSR